MTCYQNSMSDPYPIRPISEDEIRTSYQMVSETFSSTHPLEPELEMDRPLIEPERTLGAFDGALIVGNAVGLSFQMALPGTVAPVLGVTGVAVRQTHRRRGILRSLMTRQLTDLHEAGREPVATLFASESAIYGRFGYGSATTGATLTLRAGEARFVPDAPADPALRLREIAPADAVPELAKVFDAQLGARPGAFARNDAWWAATVADPEYRREGYGPLMCVLAEDDAATRGYVLFSARGSDDADEIPDGSLVVRELYAADPAAYAALWAHVLSRDLIRTVSAPLRPSDDPLLRLLADPRRARPRMIDGMWARLVDVDRALTARAYSTPVDAVIEVRDAVCPWNDGRWRLRVAAEGAECVRTGDAPDVTVPVAALGGAYFGGTRLGSYGAAGLAVEHRPGALRALSAAFAWDPAPWCPIMF